MRKVLGALALVGALWTGQAQAAYFVTIEGSVGFTSANGTEAAATKAVYGDGPLNFSVAFTLDAGTTEYGADGYARYTGAISSFTINGADVPGDALSEVVAVSSTLSNELSFVARNYTQSSDLGLFGPTLLLVFNAPLIDGDPYIPLAPADWGNLVYGNVGVSSFIGGTEKTSHADYRNGLTFTRISIEGTPPPVTSIPEPTAWAMLIAGLGMIGGVLRRQRGGNPALNRYSAA